MATKKQKHQAALARREQFLEEQRRTGLAAQKRDKANRFRESLVLWQKQHDEKHHKFVDECPHCQIIKAAVNRGVSLKEAKRELKDLMDRPSMDSGHTGGLLVLQRAVETDFASEHPQNLSPTFSNAEIEDRSSLEMECI